MKKVPGLIGLCLLFILSFGNEVYACYDCYGWHYWYPWPPFRQEEVSPFEDLKFESAGELLITVEPPQAKVYIDGYLLNPAGDLSYKINLLVGKHRVEVKARGYKPYSQEIGIQTAHRTILTIKLEKEGER